MAPALAVDEILGRYTAQLDRELRAQVPDPEQSGLYRMLRYHLGWSDAAGDPTAATTGKRLRPTLLLLAVEASGGDVGQAMSAAAAVELLHNFSLIHDDIQDGSEQRHHRQAVWNVWGLAQGINAGDAMHAVASRAALRVVDRGVEPRVALEVAVLLHECCLRLVEGQYLDLQFERRDDVTPEEYLRMIDGKTAALIATSLEMGALLGGAGDRASWRGFGNELGRSFQIADDVLGVWGDPHVTGKPAADDVRRGKRALPYLVALTRLDVADAARLRALYALPDRSAEDVAQAIDLMTRSGAREASGARARAHLDAALVHLETVQPRQTGGAELRALARFVVERDR